MTSKYFLNELARNDRDIVQVVLDLCGATQGYCLIGGLAVNAYAEPVVSLDMDIVVAAQDVEAICNAASRAGLIVERFTHSINLSAQGSDLRIQIQMDDRYQPFIMRSGPRRVLGYEMQVAAVEDVLQSKLWAYADHDLRPSKRQKDLADILRLAENHPALADLLPEAIRTLLG